MPFKVPYKCVVFTFKVHEIQQCPLNPKYERRRIEAIRKGEVGTMEEKW